MKDQMAWVFNYIYLVSNTSSKDHLISQYRSQKMGWVVGTITSIFNGRPVIEYRHMVKNLDSISIEAPSDFKRIILKKRTLVSSYSDFDFVNSYAQSNELDEAFEYAMNGSIFFKSIRIESERKIVNLSILSCLDGVTDYLAQKQYLICELNTNFLFQNKSISSVHIYGNIDILSALYFSSIDKKIMPLDLSGEILNISENNHVIDIKLLD